MSGLNWQKKSHCSISASVVPSSMQKLWSPLTTLFVEKKFWKKFWCGFRLFRVTPWREFLISWKKWRFLIFWTTAESRASDPCIIQHVLRLLPHFWAQKKFWMTLPLGKLSVKRRIFQVLLWSDKLRSRAVHPFDKFLSEEEFEMQLSIPLLKHFVINIYCWSYNESQSEWKELYFVA